MAVLGNVNGITKGGNDYLYEDTAGRTLIGVEQDSLTAAKAYAIGELFWYDNKLYKATAAIASGGTIVITGAGANAEQTTVSDELKPLIDGSVDADIDAKLDGKVFGTAQSLDGETVAFSGVDITKSYLLIAILANNYDGPPIGMSNIKVTNDGASTPTYTYTYTVTNGAINMYFELIELG